MLCNIKISGSCSIISSFAFPSSNCLMEKPKPWLTPISESGTPHPKFRELHMQNNVALNRRLRANGSQTRIHFDSLDSHLVTQLLEREEGEESFSHPRVCGDSPA